MSLIKQIENVNAQIQRTEIKSGNNEYFYDLPEQIQQLYELMNIDTSNDEFNIKLKEMLLELSSYKKYAPSEVPSFIKIEDANSYKKHSFLQLQELSDSSVKLFKNLCKFYSISV